jgi:hypothetical protein
MAPTVLTGGIELAGTSVQAKRPEIDKLATNNRESRSFMVDLVVVRTRTSRSDERSRLFKLACKESQQQRAKSKGQRARAR